MEQPIETWLEFMDHLIRLKNIRNSTKGFIQKSNMFSTFIIGLIIKIFLEEGWPIRRTFERGEVFLEIARVVNHKIKRRKHKTLLMTDRYVQHNVESLRNAVERLGLPHRTKIPKLEEAKSLIARNEKLKWRE